MSEYKAPLRDMHFVLQELAGLAEIAKLPGCEEINAQLVDQILEESAKFASGVLSPLNKPADREGSTWDKGKVITPKGFKEAYRQFVERSEEHTSELQSHSDLVCRLLLAKK